MRVAWCGVSGRSAQAKLARAPDDNADRRVTAVLRYLDDNRRK
ncbi:hypothetical protein [Amycolatopsis pithecellobii]|nr:hypothetical protein [Amycolatopsis pithecellobii]